MPTLLTPQQTREFYNKFGAKQDSQQFYERPVVEDLIAHSAFSDAFSVFEFGCGTGRFAKELLSSILPDDAKYVGYDISETMVELTENQIALFGNRAKVYLTDGTIKFDLADQKFDRVISNYVLDILSLDDIQQFLNEAHRILIPGGFLCLISLTFANTPFSRFVTCCWLKIHNFKPSLVGGCRPIKLTELIPLGKWNIEYSNVVVAWGIASEVVVVRQKLNNQEFFRNSSNR